MIDTSVLPSISWIEWKWKKQEEIKASLKQTATFINIIKYKYCKSNQTKYSVVPWGVTIQFKYSRNLFLMTINLHERVHICFTLINNIFYLFIYLYLCRLFESPGYYSAG